MNNSTLTSGYFEKRHGTLWARAYDVSSTSGKSEAAQFLAGVLNELFTADTWLQYGIDRGWAAPSD